ncbi:lysine-rich arabinogalactan protein 19-like [Panicum hallii]|uniref:lysine-rich arabinogalactan protein 19-like n=1 Tax=Panicum hallii TaxID=206008 RepID=UPI000DF4E3ED|nr:lysine-rich arabinogalactan protein 19-like [Panicum hallii]
MACLRITTCRVHLAGDDDTAELEPSFARVHMDMAKPSATSRPSLPSEDVARRSPSSRPKQSGHVDQASASSRTQQRHGGGVSAAAVQPAPTSRPSSADPSPPSPPAAPSSTQPSAAAASPPAPANEKPNESPSELNLGSKEAFVLSRDKKFKRIRGATPNPSVLPSCVRNELGSGHSIIFKNCL